MLVVVEHKVGKRFGGLRSNWGLLLALTCPCLVPVKPKTGNVSQDSFHRMDP